MAPEPKAGEAIGEYIRRLIASSGEATETLFNGTPMVFIPGDTPQVVYSRWSETREAIQAAAARKKEAANNVALKHNAAALVTYILTRCAADDVAGAERAIYLAIGGTDA